ncbi:MAG: hypothetical protein APF77_19880 [Clostridia bacterium BRH_c25]|nr:MAG: hypothetical protein APF77_19880 [Clostridia bacterium BRH_c25]
MKKIRQLFVRGLFSLLPTVTTIYIVYFLFTLLDNFLGTYIEILLGRPLPGIGVFASIVLIFITGFLVSNVLGEKLFHLGERLLQKIPILPKVYFGIKQIIDAFSLQGSQMFSQVVLLEYPRKGTYAVGFVTGECRGEVQTKTAARLINVFIPTTPNPTSGMLILVPDDEIIYLDMTVEEGLKLIVSAGVVVPDEAFNDK